MRTPRLYVDARMTLGEPLRLSDDRAHYLKHVLRCVEGQEIVLFSGGGGEFLGRVQHVGKRDVDVELIEWRDSDRESSLHTIIGLAVTKRDAMDLAIQKCTELGATIIQPLITGFITVPVKTIEKRRGHWQQVAHSACEQCERNRPPAVRELLDLSQWLTRLEADIKIVLHPGGMLAFGDIDVEKPDSIAVLVGPEGGLSEDEVKAALDHGFIRLGLGPRIMRAETAPLAILTLIQARWGDV